MWKDLPSHQLQPRLLPRGMNYAIETAQGILLTVPRNMSLQSSRTTSPILHISRAGRHWSWLCGILLARKSTIAFDLYHTLRQIFSLFALPSTVPTLLKM
jgi:hypothetical protein